MLNLPSYHSTLRPTYIAPMNQADIAARIRRLEQLSIGLAKPGVGWTGPPDARQRQKAETLVPIGTKG
jgi:hypothetical protein